MAHVGGVSRTFLGFLGVFMRIALVASDSKKDLMLQFCIAYSSVLKDHILFSTRYLFSRTPKDVKFNVEEFLSSRQGGIQQVSARVACDEVDVLIYFRDPVERSFEKSAEQELFNLCDLHNIPYATNLATAEVLIQGLKRGDLEWGNILKSSRF